MRVCYCMSANETNITCIYGEWGRILFLSSLTRAWTVKKHAENKTIKEKPDEYKNNCNIISIMKMWPCYCDASAFQLFMYIRKFSSRKWGFFSSLSFLDKRDKVVCLLVWFHSSHSLSLFLNVCLRVCEKYWCHYCCRLLSLWRVLWIKKHPFLL